MFNKGSIIVLAGNVFRLCFRWGGKARMYQPPHNNLILKIMEQSQKPHLNKTDVKCRFFIPESAQEWLLKGDRGISSETIFGAITGLWINNRKWPPSDASDFYRCYKLIKKVPEWKQELHKVAELSNVWKNVILNWDILSELIEEQIEWRNKGISKSNGLYHFMKELGC
jgi:hypothetical protein